MKFNKKTWKSQLNEVIPPLDDNVKNMPISTTSQASQNGGGTLVRSKKLTVGIAIALIVLILTGIALACTLTAKPHVSDETLIFSVEINPSVTMTTGSDGTVKAIISTNKDADIILSDPATVAQIKGKPLDEAIANYTAYASKLGFIDITQKGAAVRITACEKGEELLNSAQNALQNLFTDKGIFAVVISETVPFDDFKQRSGIAAESLDALSSAITDSYLLFNDRQAQNADRTELISLYKDGVLSSTVLTAIKDYFYEKLDVIRQFEGFLVGITADDIEEFLNDFTNDLLIQHSSLLSSVLHIIGADNSPVAQLLKLPTNLQEFEQLLSAALSLEVDYRKERFEALYDQAQAMTEQQYTAFIDEIVSQYGSLEDYWQAIK